MHAAYLVAHPVGSVPVDEVGVEPVRVVVRVDVRPPFRVGSAPVVLQRLEGVHAVDTRPRTPLQLPARPVTGEPGGTTGVGRCGPHRRHQYRRDRHEHHTPDHRTSPEPDTVTVPRSGRLRDESPTRTVCAPDTGVQRFADVLHTENARSCSGIATRLVRPGANCTFANPLSCLGGSPAAAGADT